MFKYEGGIEVESKRRDDVQLNGDGGDDAGRRIGSGDRRDLKILLLECLVRHFCAVRRRRFFSFFF